MARLPTIENECQDLLNIGLWNVIYEIAEKYNALVEKYRNSNSWHIMLLILFTVPSMVEYTLNVSIKFIRIWMIDERRSEN